MGKAKLAPTIEIAPFASMEAISSGDFRQNLTAILAQPEPILVVRRVGGSKVFLLQSEYEELLKYKMAAELREGANSES